MGYFVFICYRYVRTRLGEDVCFDGGHKLDTLLQEREDGADLPGELEWPLQMPEDAERLEEILSWDEGKRKARVSCWKFLQDTVTKYMHDTEMGRGVF